MIDMKTAWAEEASKLQHTIQTYHPGQIQINDITYTQPVILCETQPLKHWPIDTLLDITPDMLNALSSIPTLILIGTGPHHQSIPLNLIAQCMHPIEVMHTRAACQTYTVLSQEHRAVILAAFL